MSRGPYRIAAVVRGGLRRAIRTEEPEADEKES